MNAMHNWLERGVTPIADLDIGRADVIVLGELNHFVHEKIDFRLAFANHVAAEGFDVIGEEMGWSDGVRLNSYLHGRDEALFDKISLFGHRGDARVDRDDGPSGVFRASAEAYPFALMRAEHTRFWRGLSARACFGFDVAAGHDGAYADLAAMDDPDAVESGDVGGARRAPTRSSLVRVPGETLEQEAARLRAILAAAPRQDPNWRASLAAMIDGLSYTALVRDAQSYEATRPAMAFREQAMKRRFHEARALFGPRMTLMGHALHLAKDDRLIAAPGGVGPGGGRVSSLGHHIVQECAIRTFSIWMIYGAGSDSQPLADLPRRANYPADTLNAQLSATFAEPTLIVTRDAPSEPALIGHMYNSCFRTPLREQVDALYFIPRISPMRAA